MIDIKIEVSLNILEYHLYPPSRESLKGYGPKTSEEKALVNEDIQSLHFMYILADGRSKVLIGKLIDKLDFEDDN